MFYLNITKSFAAQARIPKVFLVDETANIALAAKRLAFGKYINAGQTCVAPGHVYVHKRKREEFVKELKPPFTSAKEKMLRMFLK